jgi:uncharacterized membrane protein YbaN (DUF454 family)
VKFVLFILAWISFVLGVIGAFLPILPTTPFLILSAYLFSKTSPRLHLWILGLPMAGDAIRDWQTNRVIKTKAKILSASMITLSCFFISRNSNIPLLIKISVIVVLVCVAFYVTTRKSKASV